MASCIPSVMPSSPAAEIILDATERSNPLSIPDFSNTFSTMPIFIGPVRFFIRCAGSTESNAAAPAPNKAAAPGASSPVLS